MLSDIFSELEVTNNIVSIESYLSSIEFIVHGVKVFILKMSLEIEICHIRHIS